jgi:hypothetical protein
MQATAHFHDHLSCPRLPEAADVVDDAAALDATVHLLDPHPAPCDAPIDRFLRTREGSPPRLLGRHEHFDLGEHQGQTAQILKPPAPCRQGIRGLLGNPLIVGATSGGATEKEDREHRIDQQEVFDCMALFLAAITARRLSWMLGALDAPFGAIVPKRGEAALEPAAAG